MWEGCHENYRNAGLGWVFPVRHNKILSELEQKLSEWN
jgi:hypothetical protein